MTILLLRLADILVNFRAETLSSALFYYRKENDMRDISRIDGILSAIRIIWKNNPDLRLGQLLCNACGPGLYYVEDEVLLEALINLYKSGEQNAL